MARWRPDPTFYPSPKHAMDAPRESLAYVAMIDPTTTRPDALGVVDVDPGSAAYGRLVGQVDMPSPGDELHHFGWNACSSHLCPWSPHAHAERRYLIAPGINSSQIHVIDTKRDPRRPELVKSIDAATLAARTGYAAPHTVHCGPDAIYLSALGAPDGSGPGGVFTLDHRDFDVAKAWEQDRGPQRLSYDFTWHLGRDILITSEWGTPNMVKDGLSPELLLGGKYGNALHVWDLRRGRHQQRLELGPQYQMPFELRPARNPAKAYGFVGVVISLEDLSSSIWMWYLDQAGNGGAGDWKIVKVIDIPAEPADPADLPPMLQGFKAAAPLVTDINLSLDDRFLYVSCWGTGELRQYDVSDPFHPRFTGSVRIGGMVGRDAHPARPGRALGGGPQMVELSRDGRRVYVTNGLYTAVDSQFYPDGFNGWMVKADVSPDGGIALDPKFFLELEDGMRTHQVRLQGGDASSDSFCYPS
jgi:selenium-binding protein 1